MSLTPERVSLSLRLSRISFFLPRSFTRSPSPFALAFFFLLFIPPPLPLSPRVTSPSFIARVTAFRRSDHEMISRYSQLSVGRGAAVFFFKISHTLGNRPPFSVQRIPSQSFRTRGNLLTHPILILIREIIWRENSNCKFPKFHSSKSIRFEL